MPTRIVTNNHRPKRPRKKRKSPELGVPAVVTLDRRGRHPKVVHLEDDPEADARVAAFFAKSMRPQANRDVLSSRFSIPDTIDPQKGRSGK
jgi:hypothetical protein